jgi:hypothetical protein
MLSSRSALILFRRILSLTGSFLIEFAFYYFFEDGRKLHNAALVGIGWRPFLLLRKGNGFSALSAA